MTCIMATILYIFLGDSQSRNHREKQETSIQVGSTESRATRTGENKSKLT